MSFKDSKIAAAANAGKSIYLADGPRRVNC